MMYDPHRSCGLILALDRAVVAEPTVEWWRAGQAAAVITSRLLRRLPPGEWHRTRAIETMLMLRWWLTGHIPDVDDTELAKLLRRPRGCPPRLRMYPLAALAPVFAEEPERYGNQPSLARLAAEAIDPTSSTNAIHQRAARISRYGALTDFEADKVAAALDRHIAELWPDEYWATLEVVDAA